MPELTVLFADIAQSTALFERYGDDRARSAIAAVLKNLYTVAQRFQGVLVKTIGDEIMCTFPTAILAKQASINMQKSVSGNFVLGSQPIGIRIGFHHGKVISENNDVYGDTVNVAARMAGFAKKGQIITNGLTFSDSVLKSGIKHRSLGKIKIKGKLLSVKIIEIFWQKDESQVTRVSSALDLKLPESAHNMTLDISGRQVKMTEKSPNKIIGRGEECDIQILAPMASRIHAELQFSDGNFKIEDQSTNGTWLQMGGNTLRLHRDKTVLLGKGRIALGSADFSNAAVIINFEI
ncbi:MAG TPA: adenylate/guanylate cyclase domain-containing protein [Oceanospirillales bacterium]|nr:adenylate/guanylate cyclase domain-containing protein [Oceanospirillales bacterium]